MEEKPKSAWARRQEYSKNLSKSLQKPSLSAIKRKRTTVANLEKSKSESRPAPKAKLQLLRKAVDKHLLENHGNKTKVVTRNKRQIGLLDKTAEKPVRSNVVDRSKAVAIPNSSKLIKEPAPEAATSRPNRRRLREVPAKVNSQVVKRTRESKPVGLPSKVEPSMGKVESRTPVVKPVKRPLPASRNNVPPGKRVRRGSFTITTERENNIAKRMNKPRIKRPLRTKVVVHTLAKPQSKPDHPMAHKTKAEVKKPLAFQPQSTPATFAPLTKMLSQRRGKAKDVKKPSQAQSTCTPTTIAPSTKIISQRRGKAKDVKMPSQAPSTSATMAPSTKKVSQLRHKLDSTLTASVQALKTSVKENATPIVRLPIRERLALWRERRESLEVESAERRKTISHLSDILNASRHERCFTPAPTSNYTCPYATRKEVVTRKTRRQLQKPLQTKTVQVEAKNPSCAVEVETDDLMELTTCIDKENKPPTRTATSNSSLLCSGPDIEMLMDMKDSLLNGLNVEDAIIRLNELKETVSHIEKNAHYWEVKALIAEVRADPDGAYQMYTAAAANEAEPIEVVTEALEKFLARLDASQTQATAKEPRSKKKRVVKSEGGRSRKRRSFNHKNMFESTLIQYAMQKYSPFVTRITKDLDLDSPPFTEYVTPVRRSARLSKSAQKSLNNSRSVQKSDAFLVKKNKALPVTLVGLDE